MAVRVKGATKVVDLGGVALYIFTGPVAQLALVKMGQRLEIPESDPGNHTESWGGSSLEAK